MFSKFVISAVLLVGFSAADASAKPRHGSGFGLDCDAFWSVDCSGRSSFYRWREDQLGFRTSCAQARDIVRHRGYRNVKAASCGVRVHSFTGTRQGQRFLIKVNGYSGHIWSIRRIG